MHPHDSSLLPGLIRKLSWELFDEAYSAKFKKARPIQDIYTVISSISLVDKQMNTFEVVVVGFGTKSLPYELIRQHHGHLIADMHAEMLAIRGFRRYLMLALREEETRQKLFRWDDKREKYSLRIDRYELCFYTSQIPCGDCLTDKANQTFSGAKPLHSFDDEQFNDEKFENDILRTKPGRMDLPKHKRSLSLCCSDKLALFNLLGLQGSRLFNVIVTIYIDRLIVDGREGGKKQLTEGINFVTRLARLKQRPLKTIVRKLFNLVVENQERVISRQFKANRPQIDYFLQPESPLSKQKEGFELCGILTNGHAEWLNGKTGLPEGSSLQNYATKGRISLFSDNALLRDFPEIENRSKMFQYAAIKERVKMLFGIWPDSYKHRG